MTDTNGEVRSMDVLSSIDSARELLDEHMYSHTLVHARKRIAALIEASDKTAKYLRELADAGFGDGSEAALLERKVAACRATQGE